MRVGVTSPLFRIFSAAISSERKNVGRELRPAKCRQRVDDTEIAHLLAEAELEAPDPQDHPRGHAIGAVDLIQDGACAGQRGTAIRDTCGRHQHRAILRPGQGEFGLVMLPIQHLLVGLQPGKGAVQRAGRNAGTARFRAYRFQVRVETPDRLGGVGQERRGQQGGNRGEQESAASHARCLPRSAPALQSGGDNARRCFAI